MRYQLVQDTDPVGLMAQVNAQLVQGWKLQGGISTSLAFDGTVNQFFYTQAMAKNYATNNSNTERF